MAYAIADVLVFIMLLAGLWLALFYLYRWFAGRHERQESEQLIRQIENGLNKDRKRGKEDRNA